MTQQERFDTTADEFLAFMERKTAWLADIAKEILTPKDENNDTAGTI